MDSRGLGKQGWNQGAPRGPRGCLPNSPRSCPSVLDAAGLARSLFDRLWQACGQWQQQVPAAARAPQRQWLVSAHAIRNARRRMEDRHVCLPAFNLLFGLEVSGGPGWEGTLVPSGATAGAQASGTPTAAVSTCPALGSRAHPPRRAGPRPPGPLLAELYPGPPPRAVWGRCPCARAPVAGPEQKLRLPRVVLPKTTPQPARSSACLVARPCGPPAPRSAQAVTSPRTPRQDSVDRAYFAVFDGHGGADAARYASVHVHAVAARRPELAADPAEALRAAFRRTDEMFLWKARREVSAEWGRRDRPLRGRRRKGPCRSPLASASPCSCLNGPVAGTRVGLSPAEGVRASQGGQRDCLVIGRRDDRRGALPHGSQEETPRHARATREAARVGQGAEAGRRRGSRGQAPRLAENRMV